MDFSSMCKNQNMNGHVKLLKHNFLFLEKKKCIVQVIFPFQIGHPNETVCFFYPVSIPLINKIETYNKLV